MTSHLATRRSRHGRVGAGLAAATVLAGVMSAAAVAEAATVTLYVDQAKPGCSDSGPGSSAVPFCRIQAAAERTAPGATVLVAAGTYAESVSVTVSGTATSPIVFRTLPAATVTLTGASGGFTLSNRSWVAVQDFTFSRQTGNAVYVSGSSNVTLSGLTVSGTAGHGIAVSSSDRVTVTGNTVSGAGVQARGPYARGMNLAAVTASTLRGNRLLGNSDTGIYLDAASSGNLVDGNESAFNARGGSNPRIANGVDVRGTGNIVSRNNTHENEDSGLQFYGPASANTVTGNVTWGNCDHGIDDLNAPDQTITGNSVYQNFSAGINLEGNTSRGSQGGRVANNVGWANAVTGPYTSRCPASQNPSWRTRGNFRVDKASIAGTTQDYNISGQASSSEPLYVWGSSTYYSFASFRTASGQEAHGLPVDPRMVAPASGDLRLSAGSPAIDSANASAPGHLTTDAENTARADDPATPDTGVGVRSFDDRGAYEFGVSAPGPDEPPVARIGVSPAAGPAPLATTVNASTSTDTDATPIATYAFDFGDGSSSGAQAPATIAHTYTAVGTYTVTVTVTDTAGLSSSASTTVTATAPAADEPPVARIGVSPAAGPAPLATTVNASTSTDTDATPIATYAFDFGDGSSSGAQAPATIAHTYTAVGTYTVTVTVTDTAGLSSSASTTVTATAPPSEGPNLIGNPGFETNTSGWNALTGSTLARMAGGHSGGFAAVLTNPGSAAASCTLNDSPNWITTTRAGTYTASVWVRASAPGATLKLKLREYSGSTLVGSSSTSVILSTTWQQVSVSYSVAGAGTTIDYQAYVSSAPSGECFQADDAVVSVQ